MISMKFVFTAVEVKEILISAVVLSIAFAIALRTGISGLMQDVSVLPQFVLYSFVAVGIAFLAHELIGHKLIAQHFGMHGEYRMWKTGLWIAMGSSLFGFVFAAPGAVYVSPKIDIWGRAQAVSRKMMGLVSVGGPVVNMLLAGVFIMLNTLSPMVFFDLAIRINLWLALFNMIPMPPLDGSKVFAWDRRIWGVLFAILVVLFLFF